MLDLIIIVVGGIICAFGLGPFVKNQLDEFSKSYGSPRNLLEDEWNVFINDIDDLISPGSHSGMKLGTIERALFYIAIWQEAYLLIPSWLAFKVATKWPAWTFIFERMTIKDWSPGQKIHAHRYLRWRVSQSFLIGTALNILLACVAYGAAIGIIYLLDYYGV